jgi:hypothetical protein
LKFETFADWNAFAFACKMRSCGGGGVHKKNIYETSLKVGLEGLKFSTKIFCIGCDTIMITQKTTTPRHFHDISETWSIPKCHHYTKEAKSLQITVFNFNEYRLCESSFFALNGDRNVVDVLTVH